MEMAAKARAREAELRRNAEAVKIDVEALTQARWAITSERAAMTAERRRRLETERKETEQANLELVARRSAKLKELYRKLNDRYNEELNAKGLALAKERH